MNYSLLYNKKKKVRQGTVANQSGNLPLPQFKDRFIAGVIFVRSWRTSIARTGSLCYPSTSHWNPFAILQRKQQDFIVCLERLTKLSPPSIDLENILWAYVPFLITCHAMSCGWVPWASVFQTPCTVTFHPFWLFREVDCYNFPSPDGSMSPVSINSKSSTWVLSPVTAVHEQARASGLSAISRPGRGPFALQVFWFPTEYLECNLISMSDLSCKRGNKLLFFGSWTKENISNM